MFFDMWIFNIRSSNFSRVEASEQSTAIAAQGWFAANVSEQPGGDASVGHGGFAEDNTGLGSAWRPELVVT